MNSLKLKSLKSLEWAKDYTFLALFVGLLIAGIGFIGWGKSLAEDWFSIVLISLGSAVLGTSISGLVTSLSQNSFYSRMRSLIAHSLEPSFLTEDYVLSPYRRKFHRYTVTQMKGKWVWRHTVVDFSNTLHIGKLKAMVAIPDTLGRNQYYILEAGLRDERFVIFSRSQEGSEPTAIQVYPSFGKAFYGFHPGIQFVETWDGSQAIAPCLISDSEVEGTDQFCTLDDTQSVKLDLLWEEHMKGQYVILPRINWSLFQSIQKENDNPSQNFYRRPDILTWGSTAAIDKVVDGAFAIIESPNEYRQKLVRRLLSGEVIPMKYLYWTEQGSRYWLDLCQHEAYGFNKRSLQVLRKNSREIVKKAVDALGNNEVDLVSVGCGNGEKDNILLKNFVAFLKDNEKVYYYPIDISHSLLVEAIKNSLSGGIEKSRIRIKAILGDYTHLSSFQILFETRPIKNLFAVLGNTLGNADEKEILRALSDSMLPGDLVLFEINTGSLDSSFILHKDDLAKLHDFSPLSSLGVPFDPSLMTYTIHEMASIVPQTITILAEYRNAEIDGKLVNKIKLGMIHHYRYEEFCRIICDRLGVKPLLEIEEEGIGILLAQRG